MRRQLTNGARHTAPHYRCGSDLLNVVYGVLREKSLEPLELVVTLAVVGFPPIQFRLATGDVRGFTKMDDAHRQARWVRCALYTQLPSGTGRQIGS